jgi:hypothetical protein
MDRHDKLVWRPDCEIKINNGIKALIQSGSISTALQLKIKGLRKEIQVRVAPGTFSGGSRNDPVMCEGLVLRTTKVQARSAIELLGLLDDNLLGGFYTIVPRGIDKELGNHLYGELLRTNNDVLNTLRPIAVVNWPEELFMDHYNPASEVEGTIAVRIDKLLKDVWKCVSIERTMETTTRGKYMLLFKDNDIEKAKQSIGDLIEAFGRSSDRKCAKIALDKFQEFPEFDSIQRVSQSVQSKGQRIRAMLETASAQKTKHTPRKQQQPKFQFHVNKDMQKQLPITTQRTYSKVAARTTPTKKQITITQPDIRKDHHSSNQEHNVTSTQETVPTQTTQATQQGAAESDTHHETWEENAGEQEDTRNKQYSPSQQDTRTVATNQLGLSLDQQTMTTMMTQITQQFKEMEKDRINREDRQEIIRQEREARAEERREEREARLEEKRADAQKEMYAFMQKMMIMNQNNSNNNNNNSKGQLTIPDELTTGITEQTSAITTSIVTTSTETAQSSKRSSSALSADTTTQDIEVAQMKDNNSTKRNKTVTKEIEEDKMLDEQEQMILETEQETINSEEETSTIYDDTMTDAEPNTESFTEGFNNQQFPTTTREDIRMGPTQQ